MYRKERKLWFFAFILLAPLAIWSAVTSANVNIDREVLHPQTREVVRVAEARAVIQIRANAQDASLVDLKLMLDATGAVSDSPQAYRLAGIATGTFKKATAFPHAMPITCALQFISDKQTSAVPALVLMGDVVEFAHGDPVLHLRQVVVPQR